MHQKCINLIFTDSFCNQVTLLKFQDLRDEWDKFSVLKDFIVKSEWPENGYIATQEVRDSLLFSITLWVTEKVLPRKMKFSCWLKDTNEDIEKSPRQRKKVIPYDPTVMGEFQYGETLSVCGCDGREVMN